MRKFRNGEHVIVPWGLDEVDGVVVDTFGPVGNPFVTVQIGLVDGEDVDEPIHIGFRATDIRPASKAVRP